MLESVKLDTSFTKQNRSHYFKICHDSPNCLQCLHTRGFYAIKKEEVEQKAERTPKTFGLISYIQSLISNGVIPRLKDDENTKNEIESTFLAAYTHKKERLSRKALLDASTTDDEPAKRKSLKRKRWLIQNCKKASMTHEDDIFEGKEIFTLDSIPESEDSTLSEMPTSYFSIAMSPTGSVIESSSEDSFDPTEFTISREGAQACLFKRQKRRRKFQNDKDTCAVKTSLYKDNDEVKFDECKYTKLQESLMNMLPRVKNSSDESSDESSENSDC